MSRRDLAHSVIKLTSETIETKFPGKGDSKAARSMLERFEVRIRRLGYQHSTASISHGSAVGEVIFPLLWSDNDKESRYGGDVLVPVLHDVPSRWPLPAIPVVNDQPVFAREHGYENVLITYPVFDVDAQGALTVRWDQQLHQLPEGRYSACFYVDNTLCGVFEIDKRYSCPVDLTKPTSTNIEELPELAEKPVGVDDMFDPIAAWSTTTTCTLEPGDTIIEVEDTGELCSTTFCKAPELVIRDGVTTETVTFIGCSEGKLMVERTGTAKIQAGATIRFEWTPTNVVHAAEGC